MRKYLLLLILAVLTYNAAAQKEANIWYFGTKAGLDFNSGSPVVLEDGSINTLEGCASIADSNGRLLFYTDGNRVWNRKHLLMPDGEGLYGDNTSTQSAIIVPHPGLKDVYYIFTVDDMAPADNHGMNYSQVDMSLNGGLGDINMKNKQLLKDTPEKVAAIKHANNKDIWLVTHPWDTDVFDVFLINENGINFKPVFSRSQKKYSLIMDKAGYMKASMDGKKFAVALSGSEIVELYNFDFQNGTLSPITYIKTHGSPYGIEFSPDGNLLYVSVDYKLYYSNLYQYDISSGNPTSIMNSAVKIDSADKPAYFGALQLGPDRKIYIAQHYEQDNSHYLGVINYPNKQGLACNFDGKGVFLKSGNSHRGLPTFIQDYMQPDIRVTTNSPLCAGEDLILEASESPYAEYTWLTPNGLKASGSKAEFKNISRDFEGDYLLRVQFKDGTYKEVSFYVKIRETKYDIEMISDSDLGSSCIGTPVDGRFRFKNTGNDTIHIRDVNSGNPDGSFTVTSSPAAPADILPGGYMDVSVVFTPQNSTFYQESVLIDMDYPCEAKAFVNFTGTGSEKAVVSIPHMTGYVGDNNFVIPVKAKINCGNADISHSASFKAEISYDADAFMADNSPLIKSRKYEGNKEVLEIAADNVTLSSTESEIAGIKGTVLLGSDDYSPINFESFEWSDPGIETDTLNGSLTTMGLCQENLRRITLIYWPNIKVAPNPAVESAEVTLFITAAGSYRMDVSTLQGVIVDKMEWTFSSSEKFPFEKKITLDLENYSSGMYYVRFFTPVKNIMTRLVVEK